MKEKVEAAFEDRGLLEEGEHREAVFDTIAALDRGELRVAQREGEEWRSNAWVMKAINLYFAAAEMRTVEAGPFEYHDKIPTKKNLAAAGVRVVPPGTVRYGAFVEPGVVVMPGYVNIGARVGSGTMVDTWATVGSGAQVGRGVHLAGGVGIGGVLEPPQAAPVVVEDDCLIGSRCMVVEGARVGRGAVLGAGLILSKSIPVIDAETGEQLSRGVVPPWCVAVTATRPRSFPGGEFGLPCALVIRRLSEGGRHDKAQLEDVLRQHGVAGR